MKQRWEWYKRRYGSNFFCASELLPRRSETVDPNAKASVPSGIPEGVRPKLICVKIRFDDGESQS